MKLILRFTAFQLGLLALVLLTILLVAPSAKAERWVVLGDDIIGTVVNTGVVGSPADAVPALLERASGKNVVNISASSIGYGLQPLVTLQRAEAVAGLPFTHVLLAFGSYDWQTGRTSASVVAGAKAVVLALRNAGYTVVCLTPIYRNDASLRKGGSGAVLGRTLYPIPSSRNIGSYFPFFVQGCSAGGAGTIAGHLAPINLTHMGDLGFTRWHLNSTGHAVLASWLRTQLQARGWMQ